MPSAVDLVKSTAVSQVERPVELMEKVIGEASQTQHSPKSSASPQLPVFIKTVDSNDELNKRARGPIDSTDDDATAPTVSPAGLIVSVYRLAEYCQRCVTDALERALLSHVSDTTITINNNSRKFTTTHNSASTADCHSSCNPSRRSMRPPAIRQRQQTEDHSPPFPAAVAGSLQNSPQQYGKNHKQQQQQQQHHQHHQQQQQSHQDLISPSARLALARGAVPSPAALLSPYNYNFSHVPPPHHQHNTHNATASSLSCAASPVILHSDKSFVPNRALLHNNSSNNIINNNCSTQELHQHHDGGDLAMPNKGPGNAIAHRHHHHNHHQKKRSNGGVNHNGHKSDSDSDSGDDLGIPREWLTRYEDISARWSDVIGADSAIEALQQAVTLPVRFPELFLRSVSFRTDRGEEPAEHHQGMITTMTTAPSSSAPPPLPWRTLLMYGCPGTGKTQLACATAAEAKASLISVSAADLLSKWVGESEKSVRRLFSAAAAMAPQRCVIFLDEIDALCSARGSTGETEAARRIKTEFLVRVQKLQSTPHVLVLAATNFPWDLDPAFCRRFDQHIYVDLPDERARFQILCRALSSRRVGAGTKVLEGSFTSSLSSSSSSSSKSSLPPSSTVDAVENKNSSNINNNNLEPSDVTLPSNSLERGEAVTSDGARPDNKQKQNQSDSAVDASLGASSLGHIKGRRSKNGMKKKQDEIRASTAIPKSNNSPDCQPRDTTVDDTDSKVDGHSHHQHDDGEHEHDDDAALQNRSPLSQPEAELSFLVLPEDAELAIADVAAAARRLHGYSGSDLAALARHALVHPIRRLQRASHFRFDTGTQQFRPCQPGEAGARRVALEGMATGYVQPLPLCAQDLAAAAELYPPTCSEEQIARYVQWNARRVVRG